MGRFGLMRNSQDSGVSASSSQNLDLENEAVEVLLQLQYKKDEAKEMVRKAFSRDPKLSNIEDLLNEVYRQKKSK